jgi:hypothetical protein
MTEDVTYALRLLADEADPNPIDTRLVIALAKARTKSRRAIAASAIVTLGAVGALAMTVTALNEPPPTTPGDRLGPVVRTEVTPATPDERAAREERLQGELTVAFERILPQGWTHGRFPFTCDPTGCLAQDDIVDDAGTFRLSVYVSGDFRETPCREPDCEQTVLDDGTVIALNVGNEVSQRPNFSSVQISAMRRDGTSISINAEWRVDRSAPSMSADRWRGFGSALTY